MTPGGRKFTFALAVTGFILFAGVSLLLADKVDSTTWLKSIDRAVWLAGGYLGVNVVQKIGDAFGDRKQNGDPDGG